MWESNPPPPDEGRHGLADRSGEPISGSPPLLSVDPPGIEPGLPPCHSGVIPLDHRPVAMESRGVEPRRRVCKTQLQPAGVPVSDRSGSRTHTHQVLGLTPLPVGVPGRVGRAVPDAVADPGVEPGLQAYETRTGAGPSARVARPGLEPGRRDHDSRPGACPRAIQSVVTVGVEPTLHGF